jgi:hypothetical protein
MSAAPELSAAPEMSAAPGAMTTTKCLPLCALNVLLVRGFAKTAEEAAYTLPVAAWRVLAAGHDGLWRMLRKEMHHSLVKACLPVCARCAFYLHHSSFFLVRIIVVA